MKNKITKYILLAFICLGLQACLFQEDDLLRSLLPTVLLKMWQSCRSCW